MVRDHFMCDTELAASNRKMVLQELPVNTKFVDAEEYRLALLPWSTALLALSTGTPSSAHFSSTRKLFPCILVLSPPFSRHRLMHMAAIPSAHIIAGMVNTCAIYVHVVRLAMDCTGAVTLGADGRISGT
ncbi:hypothetical protein BOTBODRAFT_60728 [Botryobasidium botryosum FD-172 SS1]|uniref:Uncharacterized protein n=1 Tax=Botryobasidium botryosum (strain FD-172 SS1) TaxID=930990 RepID=A0A067LVB4_BOTB1|nr:hypothetical protein BOTBODRAFT_60728 [Botryobasidium botryosum FD-172 SS1]